MALTPSFAGHDLNYLKCRNWETVCDVITIEDNVWFNGNVVFNKGVTIGARSVNAANSVVNSDVSPGSPSYSSTFCQVDPPTE